jgi:hypothetical protein
VTIVSPTQRATGILKKVSSTAFNVRDDRLGFNVLYAIFLLPDVTSEWLNLKSLESIAADFLQVHANKA